MDSGSFDSGTRRNGVSDMSRKFGLLLGTALALSMGVTAVQVQARSGERGKDAAAARGAKHSGHKGKHDKGVEVAQDTGEASDAAAAAADRRSHVAALERQITNMQKGQIADENRETRQIERSHFKGVLGDQGQERADERR